MFVVVELLSNGRSLRVARFGTRREADLFVSTRAPGTRYRVIEEVI